MAISSFLKFYSKIENTFTLKRFFVLVFICLSNFVNGQLDSIHYFPPIHSRQNGQINEQYVYLSTPEPTPFTVTLVDGNGNFVGSTVISKDAPNSIYIGTGQFPGTKVAVPLDSCMTTLKTSGFIASAPYDFYCNVRVKASFHATSVACKGRAALGTLFYAGSMPQVVSNTNRNFVTSIMATENTTVINITGYDPGVVFQSGAGTITADGLTIILNAGDSYILTGYTTTDLNNRTGFIGAKISSNKKIAVNTGNYLGSISAEGFQDGGMVQIVPTNLLGTEHVVVEGEGGSVLERPLVVATQDGTAIFLNDGAVPVTTIDEGEYYLIPESYYTGGLHKNMAIITSNPAYVFQCTAATTSSATSEFNFIPPLECYLTDFIDAIPDIDKIGLTTFDGVLYIITVSGAVVTVNGTVLGGAAGPVPAVGLPDWESYKLNMVGDVAIESTGAMAAGFIAVNGNAGAGAYYAGFSFDFQVEAGPDIEICEGEEVLLFGSGAGIGGVYDWDGGVIDSVAFVPGSTTLYNVIGSDIEGCEDEDSVLVTVHLNPISDAGVDIEVCDSNATTLNGNIPLAITGYGEWTVIAGPSLPTFVDFEDPTTDIEDLIEGIYTLVWTVGNGSCPTVNDTVLVSVYNLPNSIAGDDQELCNTFSTSLEGNIPAGTATGEWSLFTGPTSPTFSDITDPNCSIADLVEGEYQLIWTVSNGNCLDAQDTISVFVYELPLSDAGADQELCNAFVTDLEGNLPVGSSTGLWSVFDGPNVPVFADATNPNTEISSLIEGTYTLLWTMSNGSCEAAVDTVRISIYNLPISNAGDDISICEMDFTNLNAIIPEGTAAGAWSQESGPSLIDFADNSNANTTVSNLTIGTYTLIWTVSNGNCADATDTLALIVRELPNVNFAANVIEGCEPLTVAFVNLSTPFGDECVWNLGDGTIHEGCTDFIHTYNGGIYDVSLTVTANGCTNSFTIPDYIHAVPLPVANFVPFPSTINLTSTNVQMNNYSDNATSYTWNFGDGSDTSSLFEPSHVFPEAINGVYEVMLVAENEFGCTDTTYATVFYEDLMIFYVPNSFTPNSDGMNDSFKPIFTSRINETDFKFTIYNRWGEVVFETFDLNAAWDGTYNGVIVKDAVFIWTVSFRDTITDKKYDQKGHITVFR